MGVMLDFFCEIGSLKFVLHWAYLNGLSNLYHPLSKLKVSPCYAGQTTRGKLSLLLQWASKHLLARGL